MRREKVTKESYDAFKALKICSMLLTIFFKIKFGFEILNLIAPIPGNGFNLNSYIGDNCL